MQKIIVRLVDGTQFTFKNNIPTMPDVVEKLAKRLKRQGYIVLGEDDDQVLLLADKILWVRKEIS